MSNIDLISIFHECLERVMAGEAIEASIKDFPQHAGILRSMLETSLIVRRIRVPAAETAEAQAKMRPRIDEALRTVSIQRSYPPRSIVNLVAGLLILTFMIGGGGLFAQNSLPGDTLYGIKLLTENVQLVVSGDSEGLRGQFAERRVTEIRALIALERGETVIFQGILTASDGTSWQVAGLDVLVSDGTPGAETVEIGDLIEVRGITENGVIAQEIRLIKAGKDSTPTVIPTPTMRPTLSQTPPALATATPSATPSVTPSATSSATASASPTESPTRIFMTARPSCGVVPEGWAIYRVRIGDTLSLLSSSRGITLATLMAVNCLTDPRLIIVGQELYLPPGAETPPGVGTPGGSDAPPPATSSDGDDDDDDNDDDDDDGDDDDD